MSGTFPQLLKRSAFASHDPLITRVYAATPQSVVTGDFGLKGPARRAKGSLYLKVADLDSVSGIGATWSSGESEARFMNMWGDGSVPWEPKAKRQIRSSMSDVMADYVDFQKVAPPKQEFLPNVEAMPEAEFKKYLAYIRNNRGKFLEKLRAEGGAAASVKDDRATLTHLAEKYTAEKDATNFQVSLTSEQFDDPKSDRLQGRPHPLFGLSYSPSTPSGSKLDPSRAHKARMLDRVSRKNQANAFRDGTNNKWVVGMGGLTAAASSGTHRIADKASLSQFDYTRQRPEAGVAYMAVKDASIENPPRVIGLNRVEETARAWTMRGYSAARRPRPLQSFQFDIEVEEAPAPESRPQLGSADWVGRDRALGGRVASEGAMGLLGNRRSERSRGSGSERMTAKVASSHIENLLAKLQQSANR